VEEVVGFAELLFVLRAFLFIALASLNSILSPPLKHQYIKLQYIQLKHTTFVESNLLGLTLVTHCSTSTIIAPINDDCISVDFL